MTQESGQPKNLHLGIRVDADTMADLDRLAAKERRKTSEYARIVLEDHIAASKGKK